MSTASRPCKFNATLCRPAAAGRATWTFLVLPTSASRNLPSRGMTTVEGTLNGQAFRATLSPDGQGSHWLKVPRKLRLVAGAEAGDRVALEIAPVDKEPEPRVPAALRKALSANAAARKVWKDITPVARRDWIFWIESAKKAETRARRIDTTCDMLGKGKRRACCFDRSGQYSNGLAAPKALES